VNANRVSWTLALFFGSAIVFAGIRKLTDGQSALVTLGAQLAALALIVGTIVIVVRRLEDRGD
jgi:uncharacterized membrane protein YhaH (DUF805 family)